MTKDRIMFIHEQTSEVTADVFDNLKNKTYTSGREIAIGDNVLFGCIDGKNGLIAITYNIEEIGDIYDINPDSTKTSFILLKEIDVVDTTLSDIAPIAVQIRRKIFLTSDILKDINKSIAEYNNIKLFYDNLDFSISDTSDLYLLNTEKNFLETDLLQIQSLLNIK